MIELSLNLTEVTLPDGTVISMNELKQEKGYEILQTPCVLEIYNGVLHSITPLYIALAQFEDILDIEDPEEAFEIYLQKLEEQKQQADQASINLEHLQYQTDLNSRVLNEILEMM